MKTWGIWFPEVGEGVGKHSWIEDSRHEEANGLAGDRVQGDSALSPLWPAPAGGCHKNGGLVALALKGRLVPSDDFIGRTQLTLIGGLFTP